MYLQTHLHRLLLHFGIDFDGPVFTGTPQARVGETWFGPIRLLNWLEACLGFGGYQHNTQYLRIELYRQALGRHAEVSPAPPFYSESFSADRFATAAALLAWRDELLVAGWDFTLAPALPPRLSDLAEVEQHFRVKQQDPAFGPQAYGLADRFVQVVAALPQRKIPLRMVRLYEPRALYPCHLQRLLDIFEAQGIRVEQAALPLLAPESTSLGKFQRLCPLNLPDTPNTQPPQNNRLDIAVLRAPRDSDAATFFAQLLRENPSFRPLILQPEMNLLLEQNLVEESLPAMGVLSASLARPSLQILKLAPAFLWEPVDVFKIMEFVTLPLKPLESGLALEIARVLAEKPGFFSDKWFAAVYGYLEQEENGHNARQQYEFWFERRRYRTEAGVPKREVIEVYDYLGSWARAQYEEANTKTASLLVLAEQARRIRELLEALPEPRLSFLELERIVRTIYEPSPLQLAPAELGRFEFVHKPGAIAASVDTLVWWNCGHVNMTPVPDKWRQAERDYMESQGIALDKPYTQSKLNLLQQYRPILQTTRQLLFVLPEQAQGTSLVPHLLLGDLEAALKGDFKAAQFKLDDPGDLKRLEAWFKLPTPTALAPRIPGRTQPHLHIRRPALLLENAYETPTNLEALFYYPHRWFLRKLRFFPSNLLSITGDQALLGNLAHRLFELLLREDYADWDKRTVYDWIDAKAQNLLAKEGATLLLYGREPERNAFLNRVKHAAWALLSLLANNHWRVSHTELELEGQFGATPIRGKADLVLERDHEYAIVDLKWGGATRRKEMIRNGEDLQLVLYAHLLPPPELWPHTAYFILEDGKMIARNAAAFREAQTAASDVDNHAPVCASIFERMERTFEWRMAQLQRGMLELRTRRTASELEAIYEGELLNLLEMKTEDARFDEYRMLLL